MKDIGDLSNKMENLAARLEHMTSTLDNLSVAVLAVSGKQTLGHQILSIENEQILSELSAIKELIGANAPTVAK